MPKSRMPSNALHVRIQYHHSTISSIEETLIAPLSVAYVNSIPKYLNGLAIVVFIGTDVRDIYRARNFIRITLIACNKNKHSNQTPRDVQNATKPTCLIESW